MNFRHSVKLSEAACTMCPDILLLPFGAAAAFFLLLFLPHAPAAPAAAAPATAAVAAAAAAHHVSLMRCLLTRRDTTTIRLDFVSRSRGKSSCWIYLSVALLPDKRIYPIIKI